MADLPLKHVKAHPRDVGSDIDPRPELARLSERILDQEIRDYTALFDDAVDALHDPRPETLWARDRQAAGRNKAAIAALEYGAEQAQRLALSAADHTHVLRLLMRHDRLLLVPAWTTSRAVLEPVLMTCWLTDPNVTSQMRIARAASLLPGILEGTIAQLAKFSGREAEVDEKRQARVDLIAYHERNGFEIRHATNKKGLPRDEIAAVVYEGQRASTNHNITELATRYIPDAPFLYGLLSGATHSKLWLLNGLGDDADEAIRAIVNQLIPISDAYTRTICTYLGLDPAPYVVRRDRRQVALVRRGSPMRTRERSSPPSAFGTLS